MQEEQNSPPPQPEQDVEIQEVPPVTPPKKIRPKKDSSKNSGSTEHQSFKKSRSSVNKQNATVLGEGVVQKLDFEKEDQNTPKTDDMVVEEPPLDLDEESMVEEFEQIPNDKQREMAYIARRALKNELVNQANGIVTTFLGDDFNDTQKVKVSSMVTRLYDDPKTFFHAIKHAHKGILRNPYKNLGKVKLLDASKGIQKIKTDKITMFRQFLQQRMN